jgi:hypothetical protein
MRFELSLILALFVAASISATGQTRNKPAAKPETPPLNFVTEYVRELAATEQMRASSQQELTQAKDDSFATSTTTMIHWDTASQLELRSEIAMLRGMRLKGPFDELIPTLTLYYKRKIELHQRMIDISTALLAGPKPGVDYSKLAAEIPQIRAKLEFIEKSVFEATPLVFSTLIDMKPDSRNHASHLVITKEERDRLVETITNDFGAKLDEKDQSYPVASASVLKAYLLKDYKSADEPWD